MSHYMTGITTVRSFYAYTCRVDISYNSSPHLLPYTWIYDIHKLNQAASNNFLSDNPTKFEMLLNINVRLISIIKTIKPTR